MGRDVQSQSVWRGVPGKYVFLVLLLHYSRVMPVVGGKRYITSTAVFLNEVFKLAICLTIALYEVSKSIPPSMPATSLFGSLTAAIFTGDSWKLALPAALYTVSNSLQYIALSNLEAAQFQVTYQLQLVLAAIFGTILMRKSLSYGKWMALLLLVVGVALVQIPPIDPHELDRRTHTYLPRRLSDLQRLGLTTGPVLRKRSATYEGIQDDMLQGHPPFNARTGLLATLGACFASALGGVSFEKVLKESTFSTSMWIRNVQLAIYSIFPALFIGVIFLDGEQVAKQGFFHGYSWIVWAVIGAQAVGGIATSFCINHSEFGLMQAAGSSSSSKPELRPRPPPIRIQNFEKAKTSPDPNGSEQPLVTPLNDFSIKLPTTPLISDASALTTSRPTSPSATRHHSRVHSSRGYFGRQQPEN
ncbi:predicted protein [Uncinocarpus reesii 1704]|uniref:UDP-galactose transporter n=1 Tax=Uncinocarpus reesii (strain UAMH 1704) TaxID=336963 RepID=C4JSF9_UNCRE|nr:uncharacterized protein UREG_05398 [Uncinocarpus reesii 1704]EEP80556.1 predicted protein [Uncinocarpus reesii 1704]